MNQPNNKLEAFSSGLIFSELRKEIQRLREENSDLKFQLTCIHSQEDRRKSRRGSSLGRRMRNASTSTSIEPDVDIKADLASAQKLIQDMKWLHVHQQNKLTVQESKIQELQKEIANLRSSEYEIFQWQIPASKPSSRGRRSVMNVKMSSPTSILPSDYKEPVATLPPLCK